MMPIVLKWESKEAIINSSKNFVRSHSSWGQHSIVEGRNGYVEYAVDVPEAGKYSLSVNYNAQSSRPLTLRLNQTTVSGSIADGTTGTWSQRFKAKRDWYGPFEMKQGRNILRLETKGHFPHLLDFALKACAATLFRVSGTITQHRSDRCCILYMCPVCDFTFMLD